MMGEESAFGQQKYRKEGLDSPPRAVSRRCVHLRKWSRCIWWDTRLQVSYLRILSKIPVDGSASSSHEGIAFFGVDTAGSSVSMFDLVHKQPIYPDAAAQS